VIAVRHFHADVLFPKDFDRYRYKSTMDPTKSTKDTDDDRRGLPTLIFWGLGGVLTIVVAKKFINIVIEYKAMPASMKAMGSIEVKLDDIPLGKTKTVKFRGNPLFVRHRTTEEIERERAVDVSKLRDPQTDEERVKKDEWSVVQGVCTHLGCVPLPNKGDYGGYLCPCHGSHYDGSGRVRAGPAPLNLKVPEYEFKTDTLLVVTDILLT